MLKFLRFLAMFTVALMLSVSSVQAAPLGKVDVPPSAFYGAGLSAQQSADLANMLTNSSRIPLSKVRANVITALYRDGVLTKWQANKVAKMAERGGISTAKLVKDGVLTPETARVVRQALNAAIKGANDAALSAGLAQAYGTGLISGKQADIVFFNLTGSHLSVKV